jgi:hypothetical protein
MNFLKKNILFITILVGLSMSSVVMAASGKPVIGIGEITSTVGGNPVSFQTMLETAISQTNKFELMERSRMDDILGEQALSAGGLTQGSGQIGGLGGIDYLIYGSITKLGTTTNAVAFGGIGGGGQKAEMSVDIRVVDVTTGSIKISKTVEDSAKSGSAFAMEGLAVGGEEADPLGDVQRKTANKVASMVAMEIFPVKVINVSKGQAYVNYGPPSIEKGNFYKVVELGEGFMDPDTGEMLGQDETYIGAIEITETKSKYSIGTVLEGKIERGQIAVSMSGKAGKKLKLAAKKRASAAKKKLNALKKKCRKKPNLAECEKLS